jgi:hypothetical protein
MAVRSVGVLLVVGAVLTMPLAAQSQGLPAGVVPSAPAIAADPGGVVSGAVGTVTSTSGGVTGLGSIGSALDAPASTVSAVIGSGADSSGEAGSSGESDKSTSSRAEARSGSETGHARPGRAYQSRFDRLPRRVELLLERIELGRHIQANLRRLQALLADSPWLRARVLRALKAEIARLRAHGVTAADRRKIRRLVLVQKTLDSPAANPAPFLSSPAGVEHGNVSHVQHEGGVSAARASGSSNREVGLSEKDGLPSVLMPETDREGTFWVGILLFSLALLAAAAGATNHLRRSLREG